LSFLLCAGQFTLPSFFLFKETHMLDWFTQTYRYYNTIIELMKLSDDELEQLGMYREEIVYVAYKTHLVSNA
jgi:hypothetical protein